MGKIQKISEPINLPVLTDYEAERRERLARLKAAIKSAEDSHIYGLVAAHFAAKGDGAVQIRQVVVSEKEYITFLEPIDPVAIQSEQTDIIRFKKDTDSNGIHLNRYRYFAPCDHWADVVVVSRFDDYLARITFGIKVKYAHLLPATSLKAFPADQRNLDPSGATLLLPSDVETF